MKERFLQNLAHALYSQLYLENEVSTLETHSIVDSRKYTLLHFVI
ncbi:Hypothetical protein GL50581_3366 [Giardia duodenalis ATCC 50581]|uniref:Uncharacterized protein n=1 Tax=Giardia intestinalis (strain ATCC 50581 / GS clone H7) TaxID=598745 RepID=C6LX52_GIAIB|nr:Hypothetical protein GL50581_3366 [Giardia intestinalis ATCC 50581]